MSSGRREAARVAGATPQASYCARRAARQTPRWRPAPVRWATRPCRPTLRSPPSAFILRRRAVEPGMRAPAGGRQAAGCRRRSERPKRQGPRGGRPRSPRLGLCAAGRRSSSGDGDGGGAGGRSDLVMGRRGGTSWRHAIRASLPTALPSTTPHREKRLSDETAPLLVRQRSTVAVR
ncbi:hypothetical protein FA09DRAFT_225445 [Tilletiopsis washingtonensis]|uniref:Uncharacterized protein n=1 Tax=Tilletiopsis washingtonensis TaxID=58919 RepID=A0A316ZE34_9BASI|nr:hypothetical protein FA09DRAFT_225445 [Tilletiopsis washingtonensis]PWN99294.1 hypothetical protein FA09DRAFT_225445 [Tilletiopsis washingtonensis]